LKIACIESLENHMGRTYNKDVVGFNWAISRLYH